MLGTGSFHRGIDESPKSEGVSMRESSEVKKDGKRVELPDISYIERTSRTAMMAQLSSRQEGISGSEADETKSEGLSDEEKARIKEETGWSDEIIEHIENMQQYDILKNAGLVEAEINGKKCLVKENIDLDYTDADGLTNRERMERGLAPIDSETGKPLELHHLGQKADSPLVELTSSEHRTGVSEDGKKNQSIWHDNTKETEVHGQGNTWAQERSDHWKERLDN